MAVSDIRFRRLGYVALNVSNIAASKAFYVDKVGLSRDHDVVDGKLFLRCSDRHHDIVLYEGGEPGVKRVGWQMESDAALEAVRAHFGGIGIAVRPVGEAECRQLGIGHAFRAAEPTTGMIFEFYVDMDPAPAPYVTSHTKIARLGHVVIASRDRTATEKFLAENMNFRVSDRIDGMVTFMRCFPNPYHHSFGVAQSRGETDSLQHVNFMVTELADVGKGNNRMRQGDVPVVFGIGKHPPSESVFLYFLDPDGLTVEYSYGMEEFPEHEARAPRDMPATLASIDYWGGIPSPGMGATGAIERMPAD